MMKDFAKVLAGSRWLMDIRQFKTMAERCLTATPEAIQAAALAYAQRAQTPTMVGDIAVIQVCGPITYRNSFFSMWYGSTTIEGIQQQFRAALNDPAVRTIVFRCDSPGGSSEMVSEMADELFAARGQKPMVAIADTMMCSAAYWLFSQVDTIYGPKSSAVIGSVGAYLQHESVVGLLEKMGIEITLIQYGENKTLGHPFEKLSEEARAQFQSEVDEVGVEFDTHAARGRDVTRAVVKDTFGQGLVFNGAKAKKLGMIDQIGTFDQVMAKLTASKKRASVQAAAPAPSAIADNVQELSDTLEASADQIAATSDAMQRLSAAKAADEGVAPDDDGNCPDGYEKRDGKCYPVEEDDAAASAKAAADRDAVNIAIALGE